MPSESNLAAASFSPDALELIRLLEKHAVAYVIVGGEAVIYHGYPRLTGDIDFFYQLTDENTERLYRCLEEFWQGTVPEVDAASDFMEPGVIVQFGRPPNRIDLLNSIDGVDFAEAWSSRVDVTIGNGPTQLTTHYLGRDALLKNKRASGRPKDLDDLENLS